VIKHLVGRARISFARKRFAAEALFLLCIARLAVATLPFAMLTRWFGVVALEDSPDGEARLSRAQTRIALGVQYVIARWVRLLPIEMGCLPQAMAGSAMLRRRKLPARISLGVSKRGGLPAHAWLEAANIPITGTAISDTYAPIARFVGVSASNRSMGQGRNE
jgi:hypothetical protein